MKEEEEEEVEEEEVFSFRFFNLWLVGRRRRGENPLRRSVKGRMTFSRAERDVAYIQRRVRKKITVAN